MVKVSYEQKPYRKAVMQTFGADVTPSPSDTTEAGRAILAHDPHTGGSLGCAISEAVEVATTHEGYRYVLGSVLNQVLLHQSIIGLESKQAMEMLDEYPDIVIGCAGGGSNLGGLIAPFMQDKLTGKADPRIIAVEPASCPSFTRGKYAYDFCDTGHVTPLARMYTLGNGFMPAANHAGGLRYHGMSPILSKLYHDGYMEAVSAKQTDVFDAAVQFAQRRDHPARARVLARDPLRDRRGAQMQGDRRGQDHPVRPDRHGLFRYVGVRGLPQRHDAEPCAHRRGTAGRL